MGKPGAGPAAKPPPTGLHPRSRCPARRGALGVSSSLSAAMDPQAWRRDLGASGLFGESGWPSLAACSPSEWQMVSGAGFPPARLQNLLRVFFPSALSVACSAPW
ncbi:hypothetical protein AAFF_G00416230 [Aldrovandia affinis]|uniref:Uncharacterized protein n=1 Tax=Aldrovandia affinis TaxID=143900 RepID=A0AAD7SAD0_9TELE|nr:hypothetical protein AAFF_G00416230 [Aldrovandia affinis]